jgi:hypothetical protein
MKRLLLVLTIVLALPACKGREAANGAQAGAKADGQLSVVSPTFVPCKDAPKATDGNYTLCIAFNGLIGFAQDDKNVWALLVKSDQVDPKDENTLPPGIKQEGLPESQLSMQLPPHQARIRFVNATVIKGDGGEKPEQGRPIAGDLRFETGAPGPPKPDLSTLSDADHILGALGSTGNPPNRSKVTALDELDPGFLNLNPLDPHLVARVRIEAGDVVGKTDLCKTSVKYLYKTGVQGSCSDGNPVELAEEVDVTQAVPTDKSVTVKIGDEAIELKPQDPSQPLVIHILNSTETMLKSLATGVDVCHDGEQPHALPFRWFYRLVPLPARADTSQHFFPCMRGGGFLPPICALKRFVIKK